MAAIDNDAARRLPDHKEKSVMEDKNKKEDFETHLRSIL